jgi:hypothetical protein
MSDEDTLPDIAAKPNGAPAAATTKNGKRATIARKTASGNSVGGNSDVQHHNHIPTTKTGGRKVNHSPGYNHAMLSVKDFMADNQKALVMLKEGKLLMETNTTVPLWRCSARASL